MEPERRHDSQSDTQFSGASDLQRLLDAPVSAVESVTRAEVDIQLHAAHRFPRDVRKFQREAMMYATESESAAAVCYYSLPRSGKVIEGPSIRLAEIAATCWGHMRLTSRIVERADKYIVAQGVAHDLERNLLASKEVRRRIIDKNGNRYSEDMIQQTENAASSIALRNAIFSVIPMAYIQPIYERARVVAAGRQKPIGTRRADMAEYFARYGVDHTRLCAAVGAESMDTIGEDHLATLKGLATAIKDGQTTIEDAFPEVSDPDSELKSSGDKLLAKIKKGKKTDAKEPESGVDAASLVEGVSNDE